MALCHSALLESFGESFRLVRFVVGHGSEVRVIGSDDSDVIDWYLKTMCVARKKDGRGG